MIVRCLITTQSLDKNHCIDNLYANIEKKLGVYKKISHDFNFSIL